MDSTTTQAVEAAAATAKKPLTPAEAAFNYLVFGLSTAATAAFAYYLIADPSRLEAVWTWVRALPLVVQLVLWLLCLPWMAVLWVWNAPWALAVRLVLVVGLLVFTEYLVFPWKP